MKRTALKRKTPLKKKSAKPKAKKPKVKPLPLRIKSQKGKTWAAFSLHIRTRDKLCVSCGIRPSSQAGHYKHNSDKQNQQLGGNALWYDERNVGGQCSYCNLHLSGNPRDYAIYLEKKYGHGILQELDKLFRTPKKWTLDELVEVQQRYEKLTDKLP